MKIRNIYAALLRALSVGLSILLCQSALALSGTTTDEVNTTVEVDGNLTIDRNGVSSGRGINISGGNSVTLAAGSEDAVVTIYAYTGINAGSNGSVELGKTIINKDYSSGSAGISALGSGAYVSLGDGSEIYAWLTSGAVSSRASGLVVIGNDAIMQSAASGTLTGTVIGYGGSVVVGDGATISARGDLVPYADKIGYVIAVSAHSNGSVTIGDGATISSTTDGKTLNHAVSAGAYYSSTNYDPGTITVGTGAKISTNGATAYGVTAKVKGSKATIGAGSEISTTGANSHAVYAERGGAVELQGVKIRTSGSNAYAIVAESSTTDVSSVTGAGVFDIVGRIQTGTRGNIDLEMKSNSIFQGYTTNGSNSTLSLDLNDARWEISANSTLTNLEMYDDAELVFTLKSTSSFVRVTTSTFLLDDATIVLLFDSGYTAKLGDSFKIVVSGSYDVTDASFDINYDIKSLGLMWDTSTFATDGTVRVAELIIPEPATVGAIFGALVLLFAIRRRK